MKRTNTGARSAAEKFVKELKMDRSEALKLVRRWRQLQVGSSHSKCQGHSSTL